MEATERFLFDLQGYIVVEDALPADLLAELSAIADQKIAQDTTPDMTAMVPPCRPCCWPPCGA